MSRYVGIDPSLTRTGVAIIDTNLDEPVFSVASFSSPACSSSIEDRNNRLRELTDKIHNFIYKDFWPTKVAIEGPAHSSSVGKMWDRSGLWWYLINDMIYDTDIIEIPPTTRAKYATGKGNAGKDEVILSIARTYTMFDLTNNDEADAIALVSMLARLHGEPIDGDLPKNKLEALNKIKDII